MKGGKGQFLEGMEEICLFKLGDTQERRSVEKEPEGDPGFVGEGNYNLWEASPGEGVFH